MSNSSTNDTSVKRKKYIYYITVPLLIIALTIGGYLFYLTFTAKNAMNEAHEALITRTHTGKSVLRDEKVDPRVDNISVLFLGIDDTEGGIFGNTTRTDAMVLATFNKETRSIKLVNIPRDSRVELVGRDKMDKITHAHAYGGTDMTVATVENLLNTPVDYFVRVNFKSFVTIVDQLGGVQVDVPFNMVEQNSKRVENSIRLKKGLQTLNGEQALAFVRSRKYDDDIARGKRQQAVLSSLLQQAISIKSVNNYDDILTTLGKNIKTNFSFDDIISFHHYLTNTSLNIESVELKGRPKLINRTAYYLLDPQSVNDVSKELNDHLGISTVTSK